MATNPTLITTPFAESGDKTTPPNTNTPSDGRFSQTLGFPPVTAIPLGSGGKAPKREDFNGAFNMLSALMFYAQKGFTFNYDATQDYYTGCVVIDTIDGKRYECIADMAAGTIAPSADTGNTYWKLYEFAPLNSPAFVGIPTAPTPTSSDNSTRIATTAFVKAVAPSPTATITSKYYNSSNGSWYRVYSDGWIEQGQTFYSSTASGSTMPITFFKPFSDTLYTFVASAVRNDTAGATSLAEVYPNRTTTGTEILRYNNMHGNSWIAFGQGAIS